MRVGKGTIALTAKDRKALESWVDRPGVPLRFIIRAWIILLSASGHSTANVASRLGVSASTVLYWRNRFLSGGLAGISDDKKIKNPRHGEVEIRKIIEATEKQFPANAKRWSIRNMAKLTGVSRSTIQRIWKRHGLKPADAEFKFRHDPEFYRKYTDLAGLYIESNDVFAVALLAAPSEPASALAVQPAIQGPPPEPGPDDPLIISKVLRAAHRARKRVKVQTPELLDFLKWVDGHTRPELNIHLILPRRSPAIYPHAFRWLKRHPRFHQNILPRDLQARSFLQDWFDKTARGSGSAVDGAFPSRPELTKSMRDYLQTILNDMQGFKSLPLIKPFFWVRPDRNYLTDESQLELDLSAT